MSKLPYTHYSEELNNKVSELMNEFNCEVHEYAEEFTIDKEATCTEPGSKSRHCIVEGCTALIEIIEIPATGHKFGEWEEKKVPTCEATGEDQRVCNICKYRVIYYKDIVDTCKDNKIYFTSCIWYSVCFCFL